MAVTVRAARRPLPRSIKADVLLLTVRDGQLEGLAKRLRGRVVAEAVVLHVAGALGPEVLAPLRGACAGIGHMHPLVAFAAPTWSPALEGVFAHVGGDPAAARAGRKLARAMGMRPAAFPRMKLGVYHAAAALVASGAVALVQAGMEVLGSEGIGEQRAQAMLGPLLRSAAQNVQHLGLPTALTGVVRRGDTDRARRHLVDIEKAAPGRGVLYAELLAAQLPLARALGEAEASDLMSLDRLLAGRLAARRRREG
jgi:predicted short-subunit dehydrogenase-like oxidoreductase (DUF2520 family)